MFLLRQILQTISVKESRFLANSVHGLVECRGVWQRMVCYRHMTETQALSIFNTLGGIRWGVGKNTEAVTVIASWGPWVNFQPQDWRSWVPGVFQAHQCPRRALSKACMVPLEPRGRQSNFIPDRKGRGHTKEANLGYLPQGGPLGCRNAIAFGIQVTSHLHGVTGFPLLNVLIHGGLQKVGVFAFWFPHSDHSLLRGPHKYWWFCWLHICPHLLKHGNFRPLAEDRNKTGIKGWLCLELRSAHTLMMSWV